jgi:DNA replication and repair protein RecF
MQIKNLHLKTFRCYDELKISFAPRFTVISGPNGAGKSNILEAVTILSSCRSFRNVPDSEIIMWGESSYYCKAETEGDDERLFEAGCSVTDERVQRRFKIDGSGIMSHSDYYGRLPSVIFAPGDINLINGQSEVRRRFVDGVISKFSPEYISKLRDYKKVLAERNGLLKRFKETGMADRDQIEPWNRLLAEHAVYIINARQVFTDNYSKKFSSAYAAVSGESDPPLFKYENSSEANDTETFLDRLRSFLKKDIILGHTGMGPQRDDFLLMNSRHVHFINYASQGQRRTASLALKKAEMETVEENRNCKCVILIDDIFSELDPSRRMSLTEALPAENQVIFTVADISSVRQLDASGVLRYEVKGGKISEIPG